MTRNTIYSLCVLTSLFAASAAYGQNQAWWILFKDKGPSAERLLHGGSADVLGLSTEALQRRAAAAGIPAPPEAGADDILRAARAQAFANTERPALVEYQDLPLYRPYVEAVLGQGVSLRAESKWFNAISIYCDGVRLREIIRLPFLAAARPVRRWIRSDVREHGKLPSGTDLDGHASYSRDYGNSLQRLEVLTVPKVHDVWCDGAGIILGMVDDGYRWRTHEAMKDLQVLGERDFIQGDDDTENDSSESWSQDSHGTVTLSSLAGFKEGKLIGPAFNASFYLAKTEIHDQEIPVEEDNWVAGVEWLESRGASIISSSLGYTTFDDSSGYSWENGDFDGQTAITTRAAARAARLGVVISTAMGNEGNFAGSIIAPADADSIISVGAISVLNVLAGFSSIGPTSDGRTKPDVVAPGVSVFCATKNADTTYTRASGTSLSTPLTTGVAALVRSARPELTPVQVRDALRGTADRATAPDNLYGWGKPDAWSALLCNGMVISTSPKVYWDGETNSVHAYVLSTSRSIDESSARLYYSVEGSEAPPLQMRFEQQYPGTAPGSGRYVAEIPGKPAEGVLIRYHVSASDGSETRSSPYGAPAKRHEFRAGSGIPLAVKGELAPLYPNPYLPARGASAVIRYSVPSPGAHVTLELFDVYGRRVATLADAHMTPGWKTALLAPSVELSSGPYFYSLRAGDVFLTRSMMVLR